MAWHLILPQFTVDFGGCPYELHLQQLALGGGYVRESVEIDCASTSWRIEVQQ